MIKIKLEKSSLHIIFWFYWRRENMKFSDRLYVLILIFIIFNDLFKDIFKNSTPFL